MSNVIRFTHPRQAMEEIRLQASTWLARLDAGLEPGEQAKLCAWLAEDPAHPKMLLEMAAHWDQMSVLSGLSDMFPLEQYAQSGRKKLRRRLLLAAAATFAVATVPAGNLVVDFLRGAGATPDSVAMSRTYETTVGEQATIDLADGSQIILNTNTELEVIYSNSERRILLHRGEGLFTVERDTHRPFRVYAGDNMVEAVGTAFTVQRTREDEVAVMVTEGRVNLMLNESVAPADSRGNVPARAGMSLQAGEFVSSAGEQPGVLPEKVQMATEEMQSRLAWRDGLIFFSGKTVEEILREVSRYTTIRLEADASVRDMKVDGSARTGDVEGTLSLMLSNLGIEARRVSENHILLTTRQPR